MKVSTLFLIALVLFVASLFAFYRKNDERFQLLKDISDEVHEMSSHIDSISASSGKAMDSLKKAMKKATPKDEKTLNEVLLEIKDRLDKVIKNTSFEGIEDLKNMSRVIAEMAQHSANSGGNIPIGPYPSGGGGYGPFPSGGGNNPITVDSSNIENYFHNHSFGHNPTNTHAYHETQKIVYPVGAKGDSCGNYRTFYVPYRYYKPMHHGAHEIFVHNRPFTA